MCRRTKIRYRIVTNCDIRATDDPTYSYNGSGCWLWQGGDSGTGRGGGYGRISIDGQTSAVHKVMYVNEHGYVPSKKQIDHLCSNRLCCNPLHLEIVTHKQNQRRRRKK